MNVSQLFFALLVSLATVTAALPSSEEGLKMKSPSLDSLAAPKEAPKEKQPTLFPHNDVYARMRCATEAGCLKSFKEVVTSANSKEIEVIAMLAAKWGQFEALKLLMGDGKFQADEEMKKYIVHQAGVYGGKQVLRWLLEECDKTTHLIKDKELLSNVLVHADVMRTSFEAIEYLLSIGADMSKVLFPKDLEEDLQRWRKENSKQ